MASIPPTTTGSKDEEDREEETVTPVPIEVTIELMDYRMHKPMETEWEWVSLIQVVSMEVGSVSMEVTEKNDVIVNSIDKRAYHINTINNELMNLNRTGQEVEKVS